jgi:hypothetical protein
VCYTEPVFTKRRFFFIRQYVQPCLSKNPKYTFYTIKSSLTLAYYVAFWSCDTVRKLMRQTTQKVLNKHWHGRKGWEKESNTVKGARYKGSNTGKRARRKNLRHPRERFKRARRENLRHPRERFLVSNEAPPSWKPIEIFPAGVWDFSLLPSYRCLILFLTNILLKIQYFPSWDTPYMKYDVTHMLTTLKNDVKGTDQGHLEIRKNENKRHKYIQYGWILYLKKTNG